MNYVLTKYVAFPRFAYVTMYISNMEYLSNPMRKTDYNDYCIEIGRIESLFIILVYYYKDEKCTFPY